MLISKICVICVLLFRLFSALNGHEFTDDILGNTDAMDFADFHGFFVWQHRIH